MEAILTFFGITEEDIKKEAKESGIELNEFTKFEITDKIVCEMQRRNKNE